MGVRHAIGQIIDWLRAGYPHGVPDQDYVALFGVLRRHVSDEEIVAVVRELPGDPDEETIRRVLSAETHQEASTEDVRRVSAALAAGGWPLADVPAESA